MNRKDAPTKVCTVCGREWTKSARLTKAVFEARTHCGLPKCRRTVTQETAMGGHPRPPNERHTDSGWTERPNGQWRPPGWPDEPVINVDTGDYASVEPCTMETWK